MNTLSLGPTWLFRPVGCHVERRGATMARPRQAWFPDVIHPMEADLFELTHIHLHGGSPSPTSPPLQRRLRTVWIFIDNAKKTIWHRGRRGRRDKKQPKHAISHNRNLYSRKSSYEGERSYFDPQPSWLRFLRNGQSFSYNLPTLSGGLDVGNACMNISSN